MQQINAFLQIAEAGNFSTAAGRLGLSQPALSRTIQGLEDLVGARLFDRDTRTVQLSLVGTELLPIARRLVAEFDSAFGELAQFIAGQRGRITIAALPSIAAVVLPTVIAHFRQEHPTVDITIRDALLESVVDAVTQGIADIGVTARPVPMYKLAYQRLLSDGFCLVCRNDDPEASGRGPVSWSVFKDRPFVAMAPETSVRRMTDAAFLQAGLSIAPLFECGHLATTGRLVSQALGITALPRLTLPVIDFAGLTTRVLVRPIINREIGVVTREGRSPAPAVRAFLAVLQRESQRYERSERLVVNS